MTPDAVAMPRVLLVGNYAPDAQQSMRRFAALMLGELRARGVEVRLVEPAAWLGRLGRATTSGVGKWLAYVDKYVAFPASLRREVRAFGQGGEKPLVVHVCDHSNAVYVPVAAGARGRGRPRVPVLSMCHDLGAVRGALGETGETFCPASPTGKILQRWIARSLGHADAIACISGATRDDVRRLIRAPDGGVPESRVIPLALNVPYRLLPAAEADARLTAAGFDPDPARPFLLHVGSGLPRKNRDGVLRIFAQLRARYPAVRLVFAGEALPAELVALATELGVTEAVTQLANPSDATVEALYNRALALVFPSRFEGFGWPVIEAQACGCPVVCGDTPALAETAGSGAFVRPADDVNGFAEHLTCLLTDPAERAAWTERGFRNAERFATARMVDAYLALYRELAHPGR